MLANIRRIVDIAIKPLHLFKRRFPLISYILNRLLTMTVMLFLLGLAVFGLMALAPGDIVDQIMMQQLFSENQGRASINLQSMSADQLAARRAELGLDQPFYVQY
ncbi:MAG: ABC transporter permease, partial [Treponema sp.]|nr:ABC transporter permease [Treponema sp.]